MNRNVFFSIATLLQPLMVLACGGQTQDAGTTGGKTNWFSRCETTTECSDLEDAICAERMCTRACERDGVCSELGDDVVCATSAEGERGVCAPQSGEPGPGNGGGGQEPGSGGAEGGGNGGVAGADAGKPPRGGAGGNGDGATSSAGTGGGPSSETCVGPYSNPEEAYRCDIVSCSCSGADDDDVVCVDDDQGARHGFRCQEGVWQVEPHGVCATDEGRCYSRTENVELALSGTIPGCECSEDDFGCGVEGNLKLPLECFNGRWAAKDGPPTCLGTAGDLCSGIDIGGEFDEEDALYRGTLSLECDMGLEFLNGDRGVQLILSRSGSRLSGRIWGVPAMTPVQLTGSIDDDGRVRFEPLRLEWSGSYDWVDPLTIVEPMLDGERLTATASATLSGSGGNDVIETCEAMGTLSLQRDRTPPIAFSSPETEVSAFTPIELTFDEPVSRELLLTVSSGSLEPDVLQEPLFVGEDMLQGIRIQPTRAWPSGELVVQVQGASDAGGNGAEPLTFTLEVPSPVSATENPSFEASTDSTDPWLGCYVDTSVEYYDYDLALDREVLPSDGSQLAICRDIGTVLQAYVVPPEDATRLLVDAGSYDVEEVASPLQLIWACGDEQRELTPLEPDDDGTPRLRPYVVELAPGAENCWLMLTHDGYIDLTGGPSGAAFIDHLRFE
jgi:hypothetical protein